jgi:hypothetical protein
MNNKTTLIITAAVAISASAFGVYSFLQGKSKDSQLILIKNEFSQKNVENESLIKQLSSISEVSKKNNELISKIADLESVKEKHDVLVKQHGELAKLVQSVRTVEIGEKLVLSSAAFTVNRLDIILERRPIQIKEGESLGGKPFIRVEIPPAPRMIRAYFRNPQTRDELCPSKSCEGIGEGRYSIPIPEILNQSFVVQVEEGK